MFERDFAADGLFLLRHVDDAEAALPEELAELVGADLRAGTFGDWMEIVGWGGTGTLGPSPQGRRENGGGWVVENSAGG